MKRYKAIEVIVQSLTGDELIVSSTGMTSRELYMIHDSPKNFYMLGSMGLASSIGLGLALSLPDKQVVVMEGDGSVLMNMGSMATIGYFAPKNLTHIILDNHLHDSTGGQPTVSSSIKLDEVARAAGYQLVEKATSDVELGQSIKKCEQQGTAFILVNVESGGVEGTGRVSHSPEEIKNRFQKEAAGGG